MYIETVRKWMKDNGVSIHKLAKYVGITAFYFSNVLNNKEAMSKKLKAKLDEAMQMEDTTPIKDMAYLKIPFTRDEWKRIRSVWKDEEDLKQLMHRSILATVNDIEKLKTQNICLDQN